MLPISVVLNPRGVLCRATTVSHHRRQRMRGVSNPPVLPRHPSRTLSHAPLVGGVVGAEIAWTKSVAARVEYRLGTMIRSSLDREFDSHPDDHTEVVPLSAVHIPGEQEGEHPGGTGPSREVFPLPVIWLETNQGG